MENELLEMAALWKKTALEDLEKCEPASRAAARPTLLYLPATPISSQASSTTISATFFWLQAALAVAL